MGNQLPSLPSLPSIFTRPKGAPPESAPSSYVEGRPYSNIERKWKKKSAPITVTPATTPTITPTPIAVTPITVTPTVTPAITPVRVSPEPKPEVELIDELLAYPFIALPTPAPTPVPIVPVPRQKLPRADPELERQVWGDDFSFTGLVCEAKVVHVYDGDTIRVTVRHNGEFQQWRARMVGYDSPEMKPRKTNPKRLEEKRAALAAQQALKEKIGDQVVTIHCGGWDKYGRLLITVFTRPTNENVNEWMMKAGHGYAYNGGTKHSPFD
jgi:endonuclease YncB( thermonuclease family)